jgi:hypothetical protein
VTLGRPYLVLKCDCASEMVEVVEVRHSGNIMRQSEIGATGRHLLLDFRMGTDRAQMRWRRNSGSCMCSG